MTLKITKTGLDCNYKVTIVCDSPHEEEVLFATQEDLFDTIFVNSFTIEME